MISLRCVCARLRLARSVAALVVAGAVSCEAQAAEPHLTPSTREVSLAELLDFAEQHAPPIVVAERRRGQADAARAASDALLGSNPTLGFALGPRFAAEQRALDVQVSLAQAVEVAGQRGLRRSAALELGRRRGAEARAARWSVRHAVVEAFYAAVVGRERVALAERASRFAAEVLGITRRRLGAGDATAIELRLSETESAEAGQMLLMAERDSMSARLMLAFAAGQSLDPPPLVPAGLPAARRVPPLADLMRGLRQNHPELEVQNAARREARGRVQLADREGWPTPAFGVSYTHEGAANGPANDIVLGTLELPLPLWQRNDGERARSRADEATLRAEADLEERVLAVRLARAHVELDSALARIELFGKNLTTPSADSLALLERAFSAGELPLIDLIAARQRFLHAETAVLDAHADYYRALAELESAAGRELVP